jgi:hypothetical protein
MRPRQPVRLRPSTLYLVSSKQDVKMCASQPAIRSRHFCLIQRKLEWVPHLQPKQAKRCHRPAHELSLQRKGPSLWDQLLARVSNKCSSSHQTNTAPANNEQLSPISSHYISYLTNFSAKNDNYLADFTVSPTFFSSMSIEVSGVRVRIV